MLSTELNAQRSAISHNILYWLDHWAQINESLKLTVISTKLTKTGALKY